MELDKSMVRPGVRKETGDCREKRDKCHSLMAAVVTGCLFAPAGPSVCVSGKRTPVSLCNLPSCLRILSPPKVSYPSYFPQYRSPCHISKQFKRQFMADGHLPITEIQKCWVNYYQNHCILTHTVLEQKKGYPQVAEMKTNHSQSS